MGGEDHGWLVGFEHLRETLENAQILREYAQIRDELAGTETTEWKTTGTGRHGVTIREWGNVAGLSPESNGGPFSWRESWVLPRNPSPLPHVRTRSNPHGVTTS